MKKEKTGMDYINEIQGILELKEKAKKHLEDTKKFHTFLYNMEHKLERLGTKGLDIGQIDTVMIVLKNIEVLKNNCFKHECNVGDFKDYFRTSELKK
jgi:hypothetical protein